MKRVKGVKRLAESVAQVVCPMPMRLKGASDGLPIPPPSLLHLVAGTVDISWFLHSGCMAAESMVSILEKNSFAIGHFEAMLDFGCA
jgi:hypothetical protein